MPCEFLNSNPINSNPSNIIHSRGKLSDLYALFQPSAVAVIGATDRSGSVGKTVVQNLQQSRDKYNMTSRMAIYPVNPTRTFCCGLSCYKDIASCPAPVSLVVIVVPAKTVGVIMEECGKAGVACVIIISAGFKEIGDEGIKLENNVIQIARKYNIRVVGPNCLGVIAPHWGLNATFAATDALIGNIAFMSQSGAMCTAVLDWSLKEKVAFSAFVSIGSMADVGWGDLIDYLGHDSNTHCILIYMETIGDASHFLSASRSVAMHKPIIVIKAGQTEAAAQAAASHTGSLAGSHEAFLTAMRRAGVMVVDNISELFDCALVLGKQPKPRGENLLIITNAGGPGVLATDGAVLAGAKICSLEKDTIERLNMFLPAAWSHGNPVDILGDASAEVYEKTVDICLTDRNVDGVLVILSPQSVTDSSGTAKKVIEAFQRMKRNGNLTKPIMCSWMGGSVVAEGVNLLNSNGIPALSYPDSAARTFGKLWKHSLDLKLMCEMSVINADMQSTAAAKQHAISIMRTARDEKRELLTEAESKHVLKAYGVPVAETRVCLSEESAVAAAVDIGFPCVVKLNSETLTHKSDVGGVKLNLKSTADIRKAWHDIETTVNKIGPNNFQGVTVQPMLQLDSGVELIIGSLVDSQFGPLVLFGAGGCMVEVFKDTCLSVPPLNATLAQRQIESTNIYKALKGGQGQRFHGANLSQLNETLCRFSQMVCDLYTEMAECDINPLLVTPDRMVALDARIVLRKTGTPIPQLAIRPYPQEYMFTGLKVAGRIITIRPIHPNDIHRLLEFHRKISICDVHEDVATEKSTREKLVTIACADYNRSIPLIALDETSNDILGISSISRYPNARQTAELKATFRKDVPKNGVGFLLLEKCIAMSKNENIEDIYWSTTDSASANHCGFELTGNNFLPLYKLKV